MENNNVGATSYYPIDVQSGEKEYVIQCAVEDLELAYYFLIQRTDYVVGTYIIKESYATNYFMRDILKNDEDTYEVAFRNLKNGLKRFIKKHKPLSLKNRIR